MPFYGGKYHHQPVVEVAGKTFYKCLRPGCTKLIEIFRTGHGEHFVSAEKSGAYRHRRHCSNACKQAHYRMRLKEKRKGNQ